MKKMYLVEIEYPITLGKDIEYFKVLASSKEEAEDKALRMSTREKYWETRIFPIEDMKEGRIACVFYEE